MQRIIGTVSLGLALMFLASGCGSSPEAPFKELIAEINTLATGLESAKTFKEAEPKIEAFGKKMEATKKKMDEMKIPDAQQKEIEKTLKPELDKAGKRLQESMMKLTTADPAGAPAGMQKFAEIMMKSLPGEFKKN